MQKDLTNKEKVGIILDLFKHLPQKDKVKVIALLIKDKQQPPNEMEITT